MKKIITPYFPVGLKLSTALFFFCAVYCIVEGYWFWAVVLFLVVIIVLTTRYVTEIDLKKKKCIDYLAVFELPFDKDVISFSALDRIIVTKEKHQQVVRTRVQHRQFGWSEFTATLLMDDGKELTLLTLQDKGELFARLKEFSTFLNVDVEDRTTEEFYVVDMAKV